MNLADSQNIPDHIRRLLPPSDPSHLPPLAKGIRSITIRSMPEPATQAEQKFTQRAESKIQGEIANYLHLLGISFIRPDMRKRSALPIGWPDFTLVYRPKNWPSNTFGVPVGIEAKMTGQKPRPEQNECHERLTRNGWCILVAYSVADVQELFRQLDGGNR